MSAMNKNQNSEDSSGEKVRSTLSAVDPLTLPGVEEWVVNSVKLSLLTKIDESLVYEGKQNLRTLLLVPIFTISQMSQRIAELAPEMKTMYYRELTNQILEAEKRFCYI